jgi:hypothetical protein
VPFFIVRENLLRLAALALALVAIAVAVGCGSSVESGGQTYSVQASTTMTTASIDRGQFLALVKGICRTAWMEIGDDFADYRRTEHQQSRGKQGFADAAQASLLASIDFHIFDAIRILGAPKGEKRAIEEIIGPMQFAVESGQRQSPSRLYSLVRVSNLFRDYNRRARQYGLGDCVVNQAHLHEI